MELFLVAFLNVNIEFLFKHIFDDDFPEKLEEIFSLLKDLNENPDSESNLG